MPLSKKPVETSIFSSLRSALVMDSIYLLFKSMVSKYEPIYKKCQYFKKSVHVRKMGCLQVCQMVRVVKKLEGFSFFQQQHPTSDGLSVVISAKFVLNPSKN